MSHLHYIIAGAAESSGLVSGAATQVILDTYVYQEHTTHVHMYVYVHVIYVRTYMYTHACHAHTYVCIQEHHTDLCLSCPLIICIVSNIRV